MKLKNKKQELLNLGFSESTLQGLSEGQISLLHSRVISEQTPTTTTQTKTVKTTKIPRAAAEKGVAIDGHTIALKGNEIVMTQTEGEMKEEDDDTITTNPFELQSTQQKRQVGPSDYGNNPTVDKEMDADDADGMGESVELDEKKSSKYNPWAICTSSLSKEFGTSERSEWSKPQMKKYERCVMDVKKSVKEGKSPLIPIFEMTLENMIQKHIPPKMTKGELINTLSETGIIRKVMHKLPTDELVGTTKMDKPIGKLYTLTKKEAMESETTTAPPKVKPGTKEKPGTSDPFKNPKHQPKPKAGKNMVDSNPKSEVVKIPDYLTFDQLKIDFKDR